MATDIGSIKPINPYSIRRVNPKRDHEGKKDYPHQDVDGFASELITEHEKDSEQGEQDAPPKRGKHPRGEDETRNGPDVPTDSGERPKAEHLDVEA